MSVTETPAGTEPDRDAVPRSIILNAVSEALADGRSGVIGDERSESLTGAVYADVTTAAQRERFESALHTAQSRDANGTGAGLEDDILEVLDAVQAELERRDIALEVRHENGFELDPAELAVYRFIRSGDPAELGALSFVTGNEDLEAAITAFQAAAYEDAFEALGAALDRFESEGVRSAPDSDAAAPDSDHPLSAVDRSHCKTLYAYAACKAGRYEESLTLVEDILECRDGAWLPNLIGPVAAQEDPTRFEDGDLAVEPFLRITAEIPEETSLRVWYGRDTDGEVFWDRLNGDLEHLSVPSLADRNHLRLVLRGTPETMPTLHTYYVGLGVVDTRIGEAKTVDHVFADGPITGGGTETIRLID